MRQSIIGSMPWKNPVNRSTRNSLARMAPVGGSAARGKNKTEGEGASRVVRGGRKIRAGGTSAFNKVLSQAKGRAKAVVRAKAEIQAGGVRESIVKSRAGASGGRLTAVRSAVRPAQSGQPLPSPRTQRSLRSRRSIVRGVRSSTIPRTSSAAFQSGMRAGREDAARYALEQGPSYKKALNRHWMQRREASHWARSSSKQFNAAAKGYVLGFFHAKKQPANDVVLMPTSKSVAVIVCVMNEESTIGPIMQQLNRLPLDEVYVIVNGSVDRSFQQVREKSHAVVLSFPEPLGHDVGRAVGAKLAGTDILLFLDGDIVIPAEDLLGFIGGIDRGLDVALNNITPYMKMFGKRDTVTYMKQFLNASLGRRDLEANSLTAVPHALSRKAVETIGIPALMVPPKAQALAIHNQLRIAASGSVDVIRTNKRRKHNTGSVNLVADLIIGDHLEALKLVGDLRGDRLAFVDVLRQRAQVGGKG